MIRLTLCCVLLVAAWPAWAAQDLLETYDQALHNAPKLAKAQASLGAAKARYRQARGQLLPRLSFSADYSQVWQNTSASGRARDDVDTHGERYSATFNLSQALFNWSAWQRKEAAEARSDRARVLLSAAEQDLIVQTVQAYFDVLAARDALLATRERLEAIKRQLDRARAAYKAGLAPVTDMQEARSSLDAAQVDAIAAKNQLTLAREALQALTGHAPKQLAVIAVHEPTKLGDATKRSREQWLKLALHNAPSLHAASAALRAARQQAAAARGQRYPDIALVGSVGRSQRPIFSGRGTDIGATTQTWSVGLQLEVPIFSGGTLSAEVAEAGYKVAQARQDLVAARRQLRLDINSAWRSAQAAAHRVAALEQAIASAKTALEAARAGYRLGNRTILDVIEASTELAQRKARRKQAWYDYALARLKLRQAAGVLGYGVLARINRRLAPADVGIKTGDTPS